MKQKFWAGLMVGLLGALCISSVVLMITLRSVNSSDSDRGQKEESSKDSLTNSRSEIQDKMNELESIVDLYFLNEINVESMEEWIYKGMIAGLGDPYSVYYTKEEYAAMMESSEGVYYGIGVTVSQNVKTGIATVVKPFVNAPGYEAGILPGDILYRIGDKDVTGVDLSEVVTWIKGEAGTTVDITVVREGVDDPITMKVERRKIEVPTIEYEMIEEGIGYISIMEFDEVTDDQFRVALDELEKQGMKGVIIDIRDNPGGLLHVVTDMLDRLLPEGLIVYTEDKYGYRDEKKSTDKESFDKPITILMNGNSASASEIFAGALQDYGMATLVGNTTYGKGIVQSIIPMDDGTALKLTVSKYYTPKGRNIHETGIDPDVEVELEEGLKQKVIVDKEEDNQFQKALELLKENLK